MSGVLRLILGDQLNLSISSLKDCNKSDDIILMCEVWDEATYVRHHKKKIAFLFSAMRHFAVELKSAGYRVDYIRLDDPQNSQSFSGEVERALKRHKMAHCVVTFPGEYRVWQDMQAWVDRFSVEVSILPDDRFLASINEFKSWAGERKNLRMEFFYREMRRKYKILMQGDEPEGGAWNYDAENRKAFTDQGLFVPQPPKFAPDAITQDVLKLVENKFHDHFGDLCPFDYAVTRQQALLLLEDFITQRLPQFGDYQDAMIEGQPLLYHSQLSFYLNCGLLLPLEIVEMAQMAYYSGHAPLNAVEGFIRQIIGWREYIRGVYWLKMPDYATANFFDAQRKLPWFYWSGETDMNCLKQCVSETKQNAYAHHIQRLMVLGNFALLAGIDPAEVNEWFLVVYADAYEWVELPNVTGMILYADGGFLASKPYAAGGAYINKMSNYCHSCKYAVQEKTGAKACPFNYLYWNFLIENRDKLANNPRLGLSYRSLDKMSAQKIQEITRSATEFLGKLA